MELNKQYLEQKMKPSSCIKNSSIKKQLKRQNEFPDQKRNLKPTNKKKTIKH